VTTCKKIEKWSQISHKTSAILAYFYPKSTLNRATHLRPKEPILCSKFSQPFTVLLIDLEGQERGKSAVQPTNLLKIKKIPITLSVTGI